MDIDDIQPLLRIIMALGQNITMLVPVPGGKRGGLPATLYRFRDEDIEEIHKILYGWLHENKQPYLNVIARILEGNTSIYFEPTDDPIETVVAELKKLTTVQLLDPSEIDTRFRLLVDITTGDKIKILRLIGSRLCDEYENDLHPFFLKWDTKNYT